MANIPKIQSVHNSEARNIINQAIEVLNTQGKTIQDLVAEGQLTPEQYAELITVINGLVKSGHVDKSDLTSEFKDEIEGFSTQLAQKADDSDVRKRNVPIGLNDADSELLAAIQNKEGETTFNLLSTPRPESVTPDTTTFLKTGKNIINKDAFEQGKTINSLGEVTDMEGWSLSPFVNVEPGTMYAQSEGYAICFYDVDKDFISGMNSSGAGSPREITTPVNALYIRTAIDNRWLDEYQIEKGTTSTSFEEYKEKMPYLKVSRENIEGVLIEDGEVTEEKTNFIKIGKNIIFKDGEWEDGKAIRSDGFIVDWKDYSLSPYIRLEGSTYTQNHSFTVQFYDKEKNRIGGIGTVSPNDVSRTFSTPSDAYYMRATILTDRLDEYMIEKGSESTAFEPFKRIIPHLEGTTSTDVSELSQRVSNIESVVGFDRRVPHPPTITLSKMDSESKNPLWVDRNGNIFGGYGNNLLYSEDDWQTKTTITSIGGSPFQGGAIGAVRDLDNGELLVCTNMWVSGQEKAKAFVSEGFSDDPQTATWTMVQEASTMDARFTNRWGVHAYNNIVLLSEYGLRGNAGSAYLSEDYGKTFKEIFNFNDIAGDPANCHIHGSCFDPYRNMLWITTGDGTVPENVITAFSLDMGETWTILNGLPQQVTVFPMSDCVLFLSDSATKGENRPNAVWRLPIKNKYDIKAEDLELAFQMDDSEFLTFIGTNAFMNYHNPNEPVYFAWNRAGGSAEPGYGRIMATFDGYKFHTIYEDDVLVSGNGQGVNLVLGPTKSGKLIGQVTYPDTPDTYYLADAPIWA